MIIRYDNQLYTYYNISILNADSCELTFKSSRILQILELHGHMVYLWSPVVNVVLLDLYMQVLFTDDEPDVVRITREMQNMILQIKPYKIIVFLHIIYQGGQYLPMQQTPNPSAHVPSLDPPMFEHSALYTNNMYN